MQNIVPMFCCIWGLYCKNTFRLPFGICIEKHVFLFCHAPRGPSTSVCSACRARCVLTIKPGLSLPSSASVLFSNMSFGAATSAPASAEARCWKEHLVHDRRGPQCRVVQSAAVPAVAKRLVAIIDEDLQAQGIECRQFPEAVLCNHRSTPGSPGPPGSTVREEAGWWDQVGG